MDAKKLVELFGQALDMEVEVKSKSNGRKVEDWQGFIAGVVGALVAFPVFLFLRFLFSK